MDEKLAEFIGIYVGDGSLHVRKDKCSYEFKIVGNPKNEVEYYTFVSMLASKVTGKTIAPKFLDPGRSIGIRFCSKALFSLFCKLVGPSKTLKTDIPKAILQRDNCAKAFVRGLFDTDGCFTLKRKYKADPYYPVINFTQAKEKLVLQVAKILRKLKIRHSLCLTRSYPDARTGKNYTKSGIYIYGPANTAKWFSIIGSNNPKITAKYKNYLART